MKIGALHIGLDSSRHPFIAWHWAWSLTWSWSICAWAGRGGRNGFYNLPTIGGMSRICGLNTPIFCVYFESQMPLRRQEARR